MGQESHPLAVWWGGRRRGDRHGLAVGRIGKGCTADSGGRIGWDRHMARTEGRQKRRRRGTSADNPDLSDVRGSRAVEGSWSPWRTG